MLEKLEERLEIWHGTKDISLSISNPEADYLTKQLLLASNSLLTEAMPLYVASAVELGDPRMQLRIFPTSYEMSKGEFSSITAVSLTLKSYVTPTESKPE
jgi:hypothetical protein